MNASAASISAVSRREARSLAASVGFLTRVPIRTNAKPDRDDLVRSMAWFPLVGLLIGGAVGLVAQTLAQVVAPMLGSALAVVAGVLLTGALHVDALADTSDALGTRSRERALEVMRESTVGTYGVVAIVLDLLIRVGALDVLVQHHAAVGYAALAGMLSRLSPVMLAGWLSYARSGPGVGEAFTRVPRVRVVAALALAVVAALVLKGVRGAVALLVVLGLCGATGVSYRRWLGGVTGDTLGATCEISDVLVLVLGVVFIGHS